MRVCVCEGACVRVCDCVCACGCTCVGLSPLYGSMRMGLMSRCTLEVLFIIIIIANAVFYCLQFLLDNHHVTHKEIRVSPPALCCLFCTGCSLCYYLIS